MPKKKKNRAQKKQAKRVSHLGSVEVFVGDIGDQKTREDPRSPMFTVHLKPGAALADVADLYFTIKNNTAVKRIEGTLT